jgi:hypothetical protein
MIMQVNDPRPVTDFQKTTFCGHPRSHVTKVLIQNVQLGHADYACYWTLELLCSGLVHTLWETFFESAAIHINRAQPNVFIYLAQAYERYAPIESGYPIAQMTSIRNHPDVRNLVCEVAATMALCRKSKLPSLPTMKLHVDFDPVTIQENLKAPSTLFGRLVLKQTDPLPIAVPANELVYCLRSDIRDLVKCLYWISWIQAYAREHKKQTKENLYFADRSDEFVATQHGSHVVWLFWDAIRKQTQPNTRQVIDVLYKMYTLHWSPSEAKSKQPLLIAAVVLVCEGVTLDTTPVVGNTIAVSGVLGGMSGWIDAITRMQKSFS